MKSVLRPFFSCISYLENLSLLYFKHYILKAHIPKKANVRAH